VYTSAGHGTNGHSITYHNNIDAKISMSRKLNQMSSGFVVNFLMKTKIIFFILYICCLFEE